MVSQPLRVVLPAALVILSVAVLWPRPLRAAPPTTPPADQPAAEPDAGSVSETVVVTASRIEQREEDVAANVTVITRDEIERAAPLTTDQMLRQVPGFSLFRRASSLVAHPTTQGVSLRGIGPSGVSRTLVLLDGLPLNDPFGGWVYWGEVPLPSLERIEVIRGGASNVWGNAALGGVIQLFTRDPEPASLSLGVDVGERGTHQVDAMVSDRFARSAAEIHGDSFDTDGFYVIPGEQRGAIDVPAFSQHWNLGGRYDIYPSSTWTASIRAGAFDEERGNGTPLTHNDTEARTLSAKVNVVSSAATEWRGSVFGHDQTFASTFSSQADDRSSEVPALDQFDVDSDAVGLGLQWVRSFDGDSARHVLTAGGEGRDVSGTDLEDYRLIGGAFANRRRAGGDQRLLGIFLQDTVSFHDRFQLQIGARGDRWEATDGMRLETLLATGGTLRDERPADRRETEWSPRVALLWKSRDGVSVRGSFYQSFRAPTINELYRPFRVRNDITEANPDLQPERLTGGEVGADFRGRRLRVGLDAFWNQVDDPIANVTVGSGPGTVVPCGFVPAGGVCRQRQNLGRSEIQGAELEIELRPAPRWRLIASYLYSDTEIVEARNQPDLEGNRLAQVPRNQGSITLEWSDPRRLTIAVVGRYVGDQFEDDLNSLVLRSAFVVDLSLQAPIGERFKAFVGVENVFDERIEAGRTDDGLLTVGTPFIVHGGFRVRLARSERGRP